MATLRCKMIVQQELERIGVSYLSVNLGTVETKECLTVDQIENLRECLQRVGLEIMEDKKSILVDKIKTVIIELIQKNEELTKVNFSELISKKLDYDYTYLSNLFSESEGVTIQHFIIVHKIEKVKEYLFYDELSLKEISQKLNYSSASHLSNQFKKVTGLTPSLFLQSKNESK